LQIAPRKETGHIAAGGHAYYALFWPDHYLKIACMSQKENDPLKDKNASSPEADSGGAGKTQTPMTAREDWQEFLKTAAIAVLLALAIRTFLFEPFNIPSGSMKPTLQIGDYLFVSKPAYGYSRYSFPLGIPPIEGRIMEKPPRRGDVIVFKLPSNPRIDYIKRIVALPGETVRIVDGRLYINGERVPRDAVGMRRVEEEGGYHTNMVEYLEYLPGDAVHRIYEESDSGPLDNTPLYTVPDGHYFVMGDNRDNSQDSRVLQGVGFVPLQNIVGRADRVFFSTNGTAGLLEFWKWPWTVRYDRLFRPIETSVIPVKDNPDE
jgi:signal peptidase I